MVYTNVILLYVKLLKICIFYNLKKKYAYILRKKQAKNIRKQDYMCGDFIKRLWVHTLNHDLKKCWS